MLEAIVGVFLILLGVGIMTLTKLPTPEERREETGIGGVPLGDESYWRYDEKHY